MKLNARQQNILAALKGKKRVSVKELSEQLGVSEMTVRRDFKLLEQYDLLTRTHGGGMQTPRVSMDLFFGEKMKHRFDQKLAVARRAAEEIEPGDTVVMDTGTTVFQLSDMLTDIPDVTVATPSLAVASNLFWQRACKLIVLGGCVRPWSPDLIGSLTEENTRKLHFRKAFLGADGIDPNEGFFCGDLNSANVVKEIIRASDTVYVLADCSKIGSRSLIKYADFNEIDVLITDGSNPNACALVSDRLSTIVA